MSLVFESQILTPITYKLCGFGQAILAELLKGLSETCIQGLLGGLKADRAGQSPGSLAELHGQGLVLSGLSLQATEPGCGLPSGHKNFKTQPSLSLTPCLWRSKQD